MSRGGRNRFSFPLMQKWVPGKYERDQRCFRGASEITYGGARERGKDEAKGRGRGRTTRVRRSQRSEDALGERGVGCVRGHGKWGDGFMGCEEGLWESGMRRVG